MSTFQSSELLIEHAQRHIETFKAHAEEFSRSIIWKIGTYPIEDGQRTMVAMIPDRTFPLGLSLGVFDSVNALRSALDHIAYASTVALGKQNPTQTKFPFGDTRREAEGDAKRSARDVPVEIVETMLRFQPWEKGNPLLWGLNKLRNTKIHRLLVPGLLDFDVWLAQLGSIAIPAGPKGAIWDALNGRLDLFSVPMNFDGEHHTRFRFQFNFVLGGEGPLRGELYT